jgi:hypothetical protein
VNAWLLGISGWCATSLATCLIVGRIIRDRDQQTPTPAPVDVLDRIPANELADHEITATFRGTTRRLDTWA